MCGILGGLSIEPFAWLEDEGCLRRAVDLLAHRGPDDAGHFVSPDGRAFLGHRRLSIIDLAGGHQPIADEQQTCRVCHNGEIYNYRGLREQLIARGHRFRTHSDAEVALHLYQENPHSFVEHIEGMFAIAILDEPNKRLTLLRDRNGIKPLYYFSDGRSLIFASEIKAILALLPRRPALSAQALREYLHWKYVPAPLTIFEGIHKLEAAHVLVAEPDKSAGGLALTLRRYWDLDYSGEKITDEAGAVERLDAMLRAAVQSHLESDVEVGTLLSGGVDSSLVTALAATVSGRRIKTFSVGFEEAGFDQLPFARVLAKRYGTEHHEEHVRLDPMAVVPKLMRHFDEPFADSSALACFAVCEVAGRHVKVVLTGDGGDESFAGYRRYQDVIDSFAHDGVLRRTAHRAIMATSGAVFSPEAKFLKRARVRSLPPARQHEERLALCSRWLSDKVVAPEFRHGETERGAYDRHRSHATARGWSPVEGAQYADLAMYLPGDILTKVDRTSMACSLECRVPLLDHRITEFSARLSFDLKIRGGVRKYLLKKVAERYVPRELLYRPKMGFRIPIRRWFKRDLLDRTSALLLDGALVAEGVLDPRGLRWVLRQQRRPWFDLASPLWALLCLEHWRRIYRPA